MNFLQIPNFILRLVSGIVNVCYDLAAKTIPFAKKPFGYLTNGKNPKDEAADDEDLLSDSTDMKVAAETLKPPRTDLTLYVRTPECQMDLMYWSLLIMGTLAMIILCFTRLFRSRRKDRPKPRSKAMGQEEDFQPKAMGQDDDFQPNEQEVFYDCTDFKSNETEEFPDLKNDDNVDLPVDEKGFPVSNSPSSEQEFCERGQWLFYSKPTTKRILELPSEEMQCREFDTTSEQERFVSMAYEKNMSSDPPSQEDQKYCPSGTPDSSDSSADRAFAVRFAKLLKKSQKRLLESGYDVIIPQYPAKVKDFSDLSSDVENFPDLPSDASEGLHSVASREWRFPVERLPSDDHRDLGVSPPNEKEFSYFDLKPEDLPRLPFYDKDLDVPSSDKEERVPFVGHEENVTPDMPPEEKPTPSSEFSEWMRKYLLENGNVGTPESPSNVDLPSDKREGLHSVASRKRTFPVERLPSDDHKDLGEPPNKKEFSFFDLNPDDFPPLPSDDDL